MYRSGSCCLPSLLSTDNQMSRLGGASHGSRVYRRKSRVYGQYTRQDHPMGNTETSCSIINVYILKFNLKGVCAL